MRATIMALAGAAALVAGTAAQAQAPAAPGTPQAAGKSGANVGTLRYLYVIAGGALIGISYRGIKNGIEATTTGIETLSDVTGVTGAEGAVQLDVTELAGQTGQTGQTGQRDRQMV